ncbi:hypothetical protein ACLKA6_017884 [Drosophila palustris]
MSSQSTPTAKKGTPSKASLSAPKIPRVTFKTASKQTLKRYQQTNTLKELQQGIAKTKKDIELQSTSTNKAQQQSSPNSTGAPVTRSPANLGVKLAFSPRPQNDAERATNALSLEEDEDDGASSPVTSSNESLGPMQRKRSKGFPNTADQPEASKEGLQFSINHGKDPLKIVEKLLRELDPTLSAQGHPKT